MQRGRRRGVHRQLRKGRPAVDSASCARVPAVASRRPTKRGSVPCAERRSAPRPTALGLRKIVTIVRSDLVGSTKLGEGLSPETLRQVLARYFDAMSEVLMRHEGASQRFIGDAVMAVFGIPTVHEDDALRAVRAANEMRAALRELNEQLDLRWGVRLQARTGVNTGEVIVGDPSQGEDFVSGEAVNVATRLERSAPPREILIGRADAGAGPRRGVGAGGRAARGRGEEATRAGIPAARRRGPGQGNRPSASARLWSAASASCRCCAKPSTARSAREPASW